MIYNCLIKESSRCDVRRSRRRILVPPLVRMRTSPISRWLVLFTVMMAFLPIVVDSTILHVAVPKLTLALNASGTEVLWIIDIYLLVMASLLIPMGTLADRVGHRRLMLTGMSIFGLSSLVGAFAPNAAVLIAARAIMAIGSAMVMPCTLALIRQSFLDPKERGFALGLWSAFAAAGAAFGPLIGGALLEYFWWGSVFLVNVPIVLAVIPLVMRVTPKTKISSLAGWNLKDALILMTAVMGLVYALKTGFKPGSSLAFSIALFLAAGGLLYRFVRAQRNAAVPLFDFALIAQPAIRTGVIMALVTMGALAGVELTLAQELQFVIGLSPLQAGIFMVPLMVGAAIGGPFAGLLLARIGLRPVAVGALGVAAGCLFVLAGADFRDAGLGVTLTMAVLGVVLNVGLTASSVAIMNSTPTEKAGAAGALEATSYDLGSGLGITAFGLMVSSSYAKHIVWPEGVPADPGASHSIGETMSFASRLGTDAQIAVEYAARHAFASAHHLTLTTAAALIAVLALVVFRQLREQGSRSVT